MAIVSIVDYLNSKGQASDYNSRAKLAQQFGIANYTGTAAQNTQLLGLVQGQSSPQASPQQNIQNQINQLQSQVQAAQNAGYGQGGQYAGQQIPDSVLNGATQNQTVNEQSYKDAMDKVPAIKALGSSIDDIYNAYMTNTWDNIQTASGQSFSPAEQQDAYNSANSALEPYYKQQAEKDKADAESTLKQSQLNYQKKLADSAVSFQNEKTGLDQTAANNGVLFSGSRAQKQNALQTKYNSQDAYDKASYANSVGNTARDYQYKQGNSAASGLSQYYNAGSNNYNAGVATNGVSSNGLSSVYNSGNNNFTGTANAERQTTAQYNAARLLTNKANKLTLSGYNNQIN